MQILHAVMFQVSRGAYILLRLLAVTENQETQWLLDEIQRQPSVCCPEWSRNGDYQYRSSQCVSS